MSSAAPMQQAKADALAKNAEHSMQLASQSEQTRLTEHADLRTQATTQRRLQSIANHSAQGHQFKAVQRMAQHSARVSQLNSFSTMMNAPSAQRVEDEEALQAKVIESPVQREVKQTPKPNNTDLPDNLKSGIESLSGMSMDHVKVHYNSSQPAQLNAHAYAQGSDIHVAPGQEQHLPHEAWHVVQQAQGRVRPTMQMQRGTDTEVTTRTHSTSIAFPVQRYAVHAEDDDLGTTITTANNLYSLKDSNDNENVYGHAGAATPRSSKEIGEFRVGGAVVKEYAPSSQFVADCLHTAEEIIHGQQFDYEQEATRSRETTTGGLFGDTEDANWQTAQDVNDDAKNRNSNPAVGNAYVITAEHPVNISEHDDDDDEAVFCQYHAAAVVATDGADHITLEIFGSPDGADHDTEGKYSIYNSAPDSGLTFHDNWINTFANGITISVEPAPIAVEGDQ